MARYILFAGDKYYPRGGTLDFVHSFDDADEARRHAEAHKAFDWANILDTKAGLITEWWRAGEWNEWVAP